VPQTDTGQTIKAIINGTAVILAIFAVSMLMPILGFFCSLLTPLPVLYYRIRLGRSTAVAVPMAALLLMGVVAGTLTLDLLFYFELLLLGFVLGDLLELNLPIEKTIGYACGITMFTGLIGMWVFTQAFQAGIVELITVYVSKNLDLTLELYRSMGMSEENLHMISNSRDAIGYTLVRIIPALCITSTIMISWTNLLLVRPFFKSRNIVVPEFGLLTLWKAPDWMVWGVIGCGVSMLLPLNAMKIIGLNGLIILTAIYFLGGIAIVSFYFEKKRFPRILRALLYSLIIFEQIALFLVIGLGFFDIWLNFRKIQLHKYN